MLETEMVATLYRSGLSRAQMSEKTGFGPYKLSQLIRQAKDTGILPERPQSQTKKARQNRLNDVHLLQAGLVSDVYMALDQEQFEWVCIEANRVGCESLAEYLTELVRDAHAEATT